MGWKKGAVMGDTILGKATASLWAASAAYWMSIPPSYALLIVLMLADTTFGGIVAFRDGKFNGRKLFWGLIAKFATFPMALLCDRIEQPLHIGFHLETGFILFVTSFEFISVVQGYAALGCPGAPILIAVSQRVQDSLNAMAAAASAAAQPMKKVENTRIEVEPTLSQPVPPAPVNITKETHSEPVTVKPEHDPAIRSQ
jgi:phage-related holin